MKENINEFMFFIQYCYVNNRSRFVGNQPVAVNKKKEKREKNANEKIID